MTQEEFIYLLNGRSFSIDKITIKDGLINVDGDVNLRCLSLTEIPYPIGVVTGNFNCYSGDFVTLKGFPSKVGGDFYCFNNKLTTLEGCPLKVGGNFNCSYNKLTTLKGCPLKVGGNFNCSYNKLTTLEGCPLKVGENFTCYGNDLTTLEGLPKDVGGKLIIDYGYLDNYINVYDMNTEIKYLSRSIIF